MNTKNTPTPWARNINAKFPIYAAKNHTKIAVCLYDRTGIKMEEANENLKFIVRACNSHDALLEACKEALLCCPLASRQEIILKAAIDLAEKGGI